MLATIVAAALLSSAFLPARMAAAGPGATTRASVTSTGAQVGGVSRNADVSGDGRWVAFESVATTLVPDDTNAVSDVFVRDRFLGTTTRVSVGSSGEQGNAASDSASISRDGRWVAFVSAASNLVPGDTNAVRDIFVHDRSNGTTSRVSVTATGAQAGGTSFAPQISGDGRFVAFHTFADLATTGSVAGSVSAYRVDRLTGAVDDVCVRWDGVALRACRMPSISDDGRFVAFEAQGALAVDDTNNRTDVYVRDLTAGTTTRVSVAPGGAQPNNLSLAPSISASGNAVAFTSWASNLVPDDTNGATDVFVRDLVAGTTQRVSVGTGGAQPNDSSWTRQADFAARALSADGRYVVFDSFASNLVDADTNGSPDVFVRDRQASTTLRASLSWLDEQGTFSSMIASISADGRFVTFVSLSPLVDGDTNLVADVFVRDLRPNTPPTLSLPPDTLAYLRQGLSVTGSFSDPDDGQTWTGTVDWSDGAPETLDIAADKTFPLVHTFSALGTYTVRVTVTDSAGASATGTFVVTVATDPLKFVDERTGMWMTVQLDPAAPDHGHVVFTVPGTGAYELEAAADMRVTSATNVEIAYSGPAVFRAAGADPLAVSVDLRARLDPVHIGGSATLGDARGDRYHLVARPTR